MKNCKNLVVKLVLRLNNRLVRFDIRRRELVGNKNQISRVGEVLYTLGDAIGFVICKMIFEDQAEPKPDPYLGAHGGKKQSFLFQPEKPS